MSIALIRFLVFLSSTKTTQGNTGHAPRVGLISSRFELQWNGSGPKRIYEHIITITQEICKYVYSEYSKAVYHKEAILKAR